VLVTALISYYYELGPLCLTGSTVELQVATGLSRSMECDNALLSAHGNINGARLYYYNRTRRREACKDPVEEQQFFLPVCFAFGDCCVSMLSLPPLQSSQSLFLLPIM